MAFELRDLNSGIPHPLLCLLPGTVFFSSTPYGSGDGSVVKTRCGSKIPQTPPSTPFQEKKHTFFLPPTPSRELAPFSPVVDQRLSGLALFPNIFSPLFFDSDGGVTMDVFLILLFLAPRFPPQFSPPPPF